MCGRLLSSKRSAFEGAGRRGERYLIFFALVCLVFSLAIAWFGGFFGQEPGDSFGEGLVPETTVVPLTTTSSTILSTVPPEVFSGRRFECVAAGESGGLSYRVLVSGGMARIEFNSPEGTVVKVLRDGRAYTLSDSGVWYGEDLESAVSSEVSQAIASIGLVYSCSESSFNDSVFEVPAEKTVYLQV